MAVPASLSRYVKPLHRPIAGEYVLEDASLNVVGPGHAVRGWGTLIEHPGRPALALLDGRLEDALGIPHREDVMLHCRQVDLRRHSAIHGAPFEGRRARARET